MNDSVEAIRWDGARLSLLDQRRLPDHIEYVVCSSAADVAAAIRSMVVRGAPAIGIAAAYGLVLAVREHGLDQHAAIEADILLLSRARPTAVNLFWALERMQTSLHNGAGLEELEREAVAVHADDIAANKRMGELGASLIDRHCSVLTHCNAGALATGGYGTALGVIRSAFAQGKIERVYADETRPWLQGSRLTAWEMVQEGIPVSLLVDGAAAHLMKQGKIDWVIVGSDRIAANGDVANKIGTYSAAIAARHHGVRFMVVAPCSTIDMSLADGSRIPVEMRDSEELLGCAGRHIAAPGADAWNPVFDVTPAALVDAIVTERGIVLKPDSEKMQALMQSEK
jgi:methylthioribose-1-phosphate isomerase